MDNTENNTPQKRTHHHYVTLVAREALYFEIRQEDRRLFEIAMKGQIIAEGETLEDMYKKLVDREVM